MQTSTSVERRRCLPAATRRKSNSALILRAPARRPGVAVAALIQQGYEQVADLCCEVQALARLRDSGAVDLLLCDLQRLLPARLEFLLSVARLHLAAKVIVLGEVAADTWPALSRLLVLEGMPVGLLRSGVLCGEQLGSLLGKIGELTCETPAPFLEEIPSEDEVLRALECGEMQAALQPIISLEDGVLSGFEVLARWQRADGSLVTPAGFLPTLRRAGCLDELLVQTMTQAFNCLRAHGRSDLRLSFNLDTAQVAEPGFAERVGSWLSCLGADLRKVTFELTEEGLLQAPAISLENLLHLRLQGSGLAIDDFGVGYSSVQRLLELPFTELKLDARFVAGLDDDPRQLAVLANALELGRALELSVVAEGVECESQLQHLRALGCDRAQGYLIGPPVLSSQAAPLLRQSPEPTS